jgi:RND family efflux transporter MFP subunit
MAAARRYLFIGLWAVAGVVVILLAVFWKSLSGHPGQEAGGNSGADQTFGLSPNSRMPVQTVRLALQDTQEFGEFSGSVQSRKVVQVSSEILARLETLPFRAGMKVRKGDLLVTLDGKVVEAQVRQAEEAVGAAEAQVRRSEAGVRAAEAARVEAEQDFRRYDETYKAGAATQQQLQQAEARLKTATANVQGAQEQVAAAKKQVEGARQQLQQTREMFKKTEIRSPLDAVVVDRLAEPGDLAAPGRALLTLQSATDLRFEAPISERCARRIRDGDEVRVKVDAAGADVVTRVQEIVPAVDPQSRSFLVRADLPAAAALQPGMFGRLSFPCGLRPALRIPTTALRRRGQLDLVFVHRDGHARLRLVRVGSEQDETVEVLSGLTPGEEVIAHPPPTLSDGDPVAPLSPATEPPASLPSPTGEEGKQQPLSQPAAKAGTKG